MSKINLTTKQVMYIAAYIEEEERINDKNKWKKVYPDENDVCVDEIIRDAIDAWNGGAR